MQHLHQRILGRAARDGARTAPSPHRLLCALQRAALRTRWGTMPLAGAGAKPSNRLRSTDWLIGMCRSAGGQRYFKHDFQLILVLALASWVLFVPLFFVNIFAHVFARYGEFYLYTTASPHKNTIKVSNKSSQPEEGRGPGIGISK